MVWFLFKNLLHKNCTAVIEDTKQFNRSNYFQQEGSAALLQDVLKFIQNIELTEKFAKVEYFEIITR